MQPSGKKEEAAPAKEVIATPKQNDDKKLKIQKTKEREPKRLIE